MAQMKWLCQHARPFGREVLVPHGDRIDRMAGPPQSTTEESAQLIVIFGQKDPRHSSTLRGEAPFATSARGNTTAAPEKGKRRLARTESMMTASQHRTKLAAWTVRFRAWRRQEAPSTCVNRRRARCPSFSPRRIAERNIRATS